MGEMISNAGLFVDAGATEGGSGGRLVKLEHVSKMSVKDDRGVEIKKAIGVRGGAGYKRTQGGGTITLSEYRQDKPKCPWRQWRDEGKIFEVMVIDDGVPGSSSEGVTEAWHSVTVSKVDRDLDDDGNHMDEIELKYLSSEEFA